MKVDLRLNSTREIERRLGIDRSGHVQQFWTATVLRRIQKRMPYLTGKTIQLTIAQTDISKPEIITDEPQARTLFYGVSASGKPLNYTKTHNPQAGPRWDRSLIAAEMPAMRQELQNFIDRGGRS